MRWQAAELGELGATAVEGVGEDGEWGKRERELGREGGREDFGERKGGAGRPSKEGAREGDWADGPTKKKKGKKKKRKKEFPWD
uniref:Uncharacterized protein n=1 Tax=Oryza sativa subsp. japonica TaxID=39947 RepID=Q5VN23_ORYSJ|nr:hypothetical protein [Oryza sativa Japonica Group]